MGTIGAPVGVVIPTHNRREYVLQAARSVLAQRAVDVELVVVDDGSTDGTTDALAALDDRRVTVLRHDVPQERSAARNAGMARTKAPWVLFLDDDDLLAPDGLGLAATAAAQVPPECVGIVGGAALFGEGAPERERWLKRSWLGDVLADCVLDPYLGPNRALLRRSAVQDLGAWARDLPPFEDRLLALQLAAMGPAQLIPSMLTLRRRHSGQSDLTAADAVVREIQHRVGTAVTFDQRVRIERRQQALSLIFDAHRARGSSRAERAHAAVRALRADPSAFSTPLSRLTIGTMVTRLLLGSFKPPRARR